MGGHAVARRVSGFQHEIEIDGEHTLTMDEPEGEGGTNAGPRPTRVLAASLAACTAITIEMYADRKEWDVGQLLVEVDVEYDGPVPDQFIVTLHLPGELSEEQLERLRVIAGKCPVHRALASETKVRITDRVAPL
jgi:putative redox protein